MRNLNLDQVQTLVAIADLGTFAAAAQALHLSPPAISLHIKELEARMDTALLLRGRRQAVLTAAGEVLVAHGRQLLDASDELIDLVQRRASGREGLVKVGVSAGVSTRLLPMMLEQLSQRSPGVEVKLEAVGSAEAMQRLRAGSLDVAIVASPQPSSAEIVLTPWRNDPMVVLLPAAWKAPKRVTPDWLADKRWASFAPATQMHGLIAGWFGQAGHHPRPFLTLSYPGALKSLAAASQSAVILPLEEVEDQLQLPGVQVRHLSPRLMRPMAVAHRRDGSHNPAAAAVLEVLAAFALPG
ncbi:DNA-binding transcriptional LysR family regulator [Comamonas sp. BIGb0152]|uniref:LysR family transcriptional regulator n=1 Tax=Comamonas sp. BIGb0152 TaxID=2940601 RepID=UPI0021685FC0|nr:LysR family transcriptional regulator [Comamonas sp. BIGb0152]MCS4295282.1 DNA-binding transcriptional LysR family regulator [Comamonas sp. BIGb0152]